MSSVAEPLLELSGISYRYLDRFEALDDVSLVIDDGERLALLGANGCGKSTLLKILDGLCFPTVGSYRAFGQPVTEDALDDERFNRGFRSRVGFVFQNSDAQVFSPTVRDEVAFGPLNMDLDADEVEARVDDVLTLLELDDLAERACHQLSGGQKKKVAIASVLVMNPQVLLFDEPTAALDPRTQQWLIELLGELSRAGKTIVLATHDLHRLEEVADRALVFSEDHRLVADGSPTAILDDLDLLARVNLIHTHVHSHGTLTHSHLHGHGHHAHPG